MMKLIITTLLILCSAASSASVIEIKFQGLLNQSTDLYGNALNGKQDGDLVSGSIFVDLGLMPADYTASADDGNYFIRSGNNYSLVSTSFDDFNFFAPKVPYQAPVFIDQVVVNDDFDSSQNDRLYIKEFFNSNGNTLGCYGSNMYCTSTELTLSLKPDTFNGDAFPQSFTAADLLPRSELLFKFVTNDQGDLVSTQGKIQLTNVSIAAATVPEPSTIGLMCLGLLGAFARRNKS